MDPRASCIDESEEEKLRNMLEWYEECDKLICDSIMLSGSATDIDNAKEVKKFFLKSVDIKSIENYLAYYKPIKLDVLKLNTLLDCAYVVQTKEKT